MAKPSTGLRNAIANVLGLLTPLAIFILVTPYLIHKLGVSQFGVITIFVTSVTLLTTFDFGLSAGGLRILGESLHTKNLNEFRATARELWSAYLLIGLLFSGLVFLFRSWLLIRIGLSEELARGGLGYALPIAIFFGFASLACSVIPRVMEVFLGLMAIQVIFGSLTWLGLALLVWADVEANLIFSWFALVSFTTFLMLAWWANKISGGLNWTPCFRFPRMRNSVSYSFHAFLAQLSSGVIYHLDKLLVASFLGTAAVGYYGTVTNLASKILALVGALAGFVFPRVVRLYVSEDTEGLRLTYLRSTRYVLLITWPILIVAMILGEIFLRLWVGQEFSGRTDNVLPILLTSYFIASISVVASQVFNGIGNSKIGAIFALTALVINLVGCMVLIPRWGINGAALASLFSMVQVFGYTYALHRYLQLGRWPFFGLWWRLVIVGIMQASILFLTRNMIDNWASLIVMTFLSWGSFYIIWYVFLFADSGDREIFDRIYQSCLNYVRSGN